MKRILNLVYLGGVYSLGSIFERGITFIFIPIYTAYLSPADYGITGLMTLAVGLSIKLFYPPVNQGFIRHYHSPEYIDKQGLLLFNSLLFLAIQAFIFAIIFFFLSKIIASAILKDEGLFFIVKVYSIILFCQPLSNFLLNFLKQREKAKTIILISWLHGILFAAIVLTGLIVFKLGVLALIYGLLAGLIFKVCCIFPMFWKESTHEISIKVMLKPLKYGYPRIISGCSNLLIQSGDRYVLLLLSTMSSVGLYNFGYQIASIINFVLVIPLMNAIQPISFKQEGDPEKQKIFLRNTCTHYYLAGMFICLFFSLYSQEIVEVIASNEEFWRSWVVVPIIAYSYILVGLGNYFDWGLIMTKNGFRISLNVVIGATVNIGLNFMLIPFWGIMGAAFSTLISLFVLNALRVYYSAKFYDLYFDFGRILHITIVGVGLYFLSLFVAPAFSPLLNFGLKFGILLLFPVVIFYTGYFTASEKISIPKLFNMIWGHGLNNAYQKVNI